MSKKIRQNKKDNASLEDALKASYEALENQENNKNQENGNHNSALKQEKESAAQEERINDRDDAITNPISGEKSSSNTASEEVVELLDGAKFKAIFDPYKELLLSGGMDAYEATEMLLAAHQALEKNPKETLHWLAQYYGVDLPVSNKMQDSKLPDFMEAQLQHLSSEKTKEGKFKYPHLSILQNEVRNMLISGRAKNIEDAYEMACWSQPDLREERLNEIRAQIEKEIEEAVEKRRQKAEKAAELNLDQKGTILNTSQLSKGSIKDTMAQIYDQYIGS